MVQRISAIFLSLLLIGCNAIVERPKPLRNPPPIPEVSVGLNELLRLQERREIFGIEYPSDSTMALNFEKLATPLGYRINLRISELAIPLIEALRHANMADSATRLIELVQWGSSVNIRAQAMVSLAGYSNPAHLALFKSVLFEQDPALRCAAIEALQIWNQEGTMDLLKQMSRESATPVVQIFAVQAMLALGDKSMLPFLVQGLDSGSWVVRALCARYLGDYGNASHYERLAKLVSQETLNDFVIAEAALAALKLYSRKEQAMVSYSPATKMWRENEDVEYWLREDKSIDIEPLIIVPPRLYIHDGNAIPLPINEKLMKLINNRLESPLSDADANDPNYEQLNNLATPSGFALKTRYSKLSYLVAEGLAGTRDLYLRNELERIALSSKNSSTRATALVSLAFGASDYPTAIQESMASEDPVVRFGAIEAVISGKLQQGIPALRAIALNDPIPAFRVVALGALFQMGDPAASNLLLPHLNSSDWPSRSLAFWYLGRYGTGRDFSMALNAYPTEQNPFVKAEIILAVLRLREVYED